MNIFVSSTLANEGFDVWQIFEVSEHLAWCVGSARRIEPVVPRKGYALMNLH